MNIESPEYLTDTLKNFNTCNTCNKTKKMYRKKYEY